MPQQEARNESQLVGHIWKALLAEYPTMWIMKVHGGPMQMPGVPDLLMCVFGIFIGMEVKHKKPGESEEHARGRVTPLQAAHIRKINDAGGMAGVVISVEEALDMVARAMRKQKEIQGVAQHDEQ